MTALRFELKNVKYAAFASQETPCYSATLYVDGEKVAEVGNQGHGGCDTYYPSKGSKWTYETLDAAIKAQLPMIEASFDGPDDKPFTYAPSVETVCGELLDGFLAEKAIKADLAKFLLAEGPNGIRTWAKKQKGQNVEVRARISIVAKEPDIKFLNDLPMDEVIATYKRHHLI